MSTPEITLVLVLTLFFFLFFDFPLSSRFQTFPQNMKKSWHPRTFANIERVWKREQSMMAERRQIEQLQKELAEERAREEVRRMAEDTGHRSVLILLFTWTAPDPFSVYSSHPQFSPPCFFPNLSFSKQQQSRRPTGLDVSGHHEFWRPRCLLAWQSCGPHRAEEGQGGR